MEPNQDTNETPGIEGIPVEQPANPVSEASVFDDASEILVNDAASGGDGNQALSENEMAQENLTEDVSHVSSGIDMSQGTPKKRVNGMLVAMICLGVAAVFGVGFGIWAMVDGNSQKEKYESKISILEQDNVDLKKKLEDEDVTIEIDEVEDEEEPESVPVKKDNTKDYIYIGEWGMKIKLSDELTKVGYAFVQDNGATGVRVFGMKKRSENEDAFPDFANMNKNTIPLGTVTRYSKGTELPAASAPEWIFSDDQYDYYYSHPQAVYSNTEDEGNWEIDSVDVVKDMLKNEGNYSSF